MPQGCRRRGDGHLWQEKKSTKYLFACRTSLHGNDVPPSSFPNTHSHAAQALLGATFPPMEACPRVHRAGWLYRRFSRGSTSLAAALQLILRLLAACLVTSLVGKLGETIFPYKAMLFIHSNLLGCVLAHFIAAILLYTLYY